MSMKNLIYQRSAPDMVLISISVTPDGNVGNVSNDENEAMLFDSEAQANETIETLDGRGSFWGARPTKRKPKPNK